MTHIFVKPFIYLGLDTKKEHQFLDALSSGRQDSNLRPPGPKPGALPACATPRTLFRFCRFVKDAVRAGFEPAIRVNHVCQFSKLVDSASLPPHLWPFTINPYF